jgi:hypothetical protein
VCWMGGDLWAPALLVTSIFPIQHTVDHWLHYSKTRSSAQFCCFLPTTLLPVCILSKLRTTPQETISFLLTSSLL